MNNVKPIFIDVDGTLFDYESYSVRQSTKDIIKELYESKQYDIYVSTGRGVNNCNILNDIKPYIKGYNVVNGGQIIIDNKVVYENYISIDVIKRLINTLDDLKASYSMLASNHEYRHFSSKEAQIEFDSKVQNPYILIDYDDLSWIDKVIQVWIIEPNELLDKVQALFPELHVFYWGQVGADVVPNGRTKGTGIKKVIEIMDYDVNNTYGIGDAANDLPMFEAVKVSICMGNGTPEAKNAATYITETSGKDGLALGIKQYILK